MHPIPLCRLLGLSCSFPADQPSITAGVAGGHPPTTKLRTEEGLGLWLGVRGDGALPRALLGACTRVRRNQEHRFGQIFSRLCISLLRATPQGGNANAAPLRLPCKRIPLQSIGTSTHALCKVPRPSDQPHSKGAAATPGPAAMALPQPEGAWRDFVDHAFFAPCTRHAAACSARDSTTNWWSFTSHQPACSVCVAGSPLETYIQARRGLGRGPGQAGEPDRRPAPLGPGLHAARPSYLWSMLPLGLRGARNGPGASRREGQRRRPGLHDAALAPAPTGGKSANPAHLQVRRSSYHDVVKMADISRFADIAGIQGELEAPGLAALRR